MPRSHENARHPAGAALRVAETATVQPRRVRGSFNTTTTHSSRGEQVSPEIWTATCPGGRVAPSPSIVALVNCQVSIGASPTRPGASRRAGLDPGSDSIGASRLETRSGGRQVGELPHHHEQLAPGRVGSCLKSGRQLVPGRVDALAVDRGLSSNCQVSIGASPTRPGASRRAGLASRLETCPWRSRRPDPPRAALPTDARLCARINPRRFVRPVPRTSQPLARHAEVLQAEALEDSLRLVGRYRRVTAKKRHDVGRPSEQRRKLTGGSRHLGRDAQGSGRPEDPKMSSPHRRGSHCGRPA